MSILIVVCLVFACLAISLLGKKLLKPKSSNPNLPPGSYGWPLVGETLKFMAAHQKGALEEFILSKTKQYASPIFKSSLFGERVVILSGVDANKFLFSNEEKLFNRWRPRTVQKLFPSMEFVPIEHDHKKGKKYVSFLFKNDTRRKLVATIDSIARNQLQILSKTLQLEGHDS
ncbi:hypothetical protein ACFE04_019063 [Oxalis oulophora]